MKGTNLAGMSTTRYRVEEDYYATPFESVKKILNEIELKGNILEPACGEGHIVKILKEYYPNNEIIATDLIQRNDLFDCGIIGNVNFLNTEYEKKFDNIITNPPFNLIQEFIEKALSITNDKVIIFAKIQLLEGKKRKELFKNTPLKYVYVFSERQNPLRNGNELDENGKPWSSTMCFAWFVWEKGFIGETIIRWI